MPTTSKSWTTINRLLAKNTHERTPVVHPGEMVREEFMVPLNLTANALALALRVPATRISEIVNERRRVSGDMAIRLGHDFRMGPEFWMNLQAYYEVDIARHTRDLASLKEIEPALVNERGELLARLA